MTIANGADDLVAYIPVFALQSFREKGITAVMFTALAIALFALGWMAVQHPT